MKTISISKIALALLISVPALTLNGAATLTKTFTPKVSLLGRFGEMTKKGCASLWAKTKSVVNTSVSYVQKNPKTVAKYTGVAAVTTLGLCGLYTGYHKWLAPKKTGKPATSTNKNEKPDSTTATENSKNATLARLGV